MYTVQIPRARKPINPGQVAKVLALKNIRWLCYQNSVLMVFYMKLWGSFTQSISTVVAASIVPPFEGPSP